MFEHRQHFSSRGRLTLLSIGLLVMILLCLPWSAGINIPALLEEQTQQIVFAHQGAWVDAVLVHNGDHVNVGDVMIRLSSPALNAKLVTTTASMKEATARLTAVSLRIKNLDQVTVLTENLAEHTLERDAIVSDIHQLTVTAPVAGTVRDMPIELRTAIWVRQHQPLAMVVAAGEHDLRAVGYVGETEYERIQLGQSVHFYPSANPAERLSGILTTLAIARTLHVEERALTQAGGGAVPTEYQAGTGKEWVHGAYYRAEARIDRNDRTLMHTIVGELRIDSASYNPVMDACVKAIGILRGELAF